MAFNFDHTNSGELTIKGSYSAFTGQFIFPKVTGSNTATFLTIGAANIDGISDLQSCLDLLTNAVDIKTASTLNAGFASGNALYVGSDGYVNIENLPDSVCNNVYVVNSTGQLLLLNQAKKGSIGITTNNYGTYILTGSLFNNINNWVGLLNPDNCVDSVNGATGTVVIKASGLNAAYFGSNIECSLDYLNTGFISTGSLDSIYEKCSDFDTCLADYSTTSWLSNELSSYPTTGETTGCLGNYTNNAATGSLFGSYVLCSSIGDAACSYHNVGTGAGSILCVNEFGFIDDVVIPTYGLTETFIVSSYAELATLNTADVGDVAFDTVNHINYILNSDLDWVALAAEEGSVLLVNNHAGDAESLVTLNTTDICDSWYGGDYSVTCIIKETNLSINYVITDSPYETSGSFIETRSGYALISEFDSIAATKSVTGHGHAISDVTDLQSCLNDYSPFEKSNLINLGESYSYQLSQDSSANACVSLILGNEGKSTNSCSVVQSAGMFAEYGDAQFSTIVGKKYVSNGTWNDIISVEMAENSAAVIRASVISRTCDAFTLEGSIVEQDGSVVLEGDFSKNIYFTGSASNDVRVCVGATNFALQTIGNGYWAAAMEMTYVKPTGGASLYGSYWSGVVENSWYDVPNNWFVDSSLVGHASYLPRDIDNVILIGSNAPHVDMDDAAWVQPNSIDSTRISDPDGVLFFSENGAIFDGTIYGKVVFSGNASFV